MNTNRLFTVIRLLVLGVLVAGFNAKAAPPAFQGTFTLPSEVRWGIATLPAGDYSFTLDLDSGFGMIKVYRGINAVAMIPTVGPGDSESDRSEIVMEDGAVRKVNLPQIGVSLNYPSPNSRHRAAPEETEAALHIPVAARRAGR